MLLSRQQMHIASHHEAGIHVAVCLPMLFAQQLQLAEQGGEVAPLWL